MPSWLADPERICGRPIMSGKVDDIRRPRRSASAEAALRAEVRRVSRITIEERVISALTVRERFAWIGIPSSPAAWDHS